MGENNVIRVVLCDDNMQIHRVVAALLGATQGVQLVGQGANGRDAFDLCAQLKPDVVLMDVLMPGMNGIEATRQIREKFPEIKVLVLSSLQDHESVYEMMRNGAAGYITKNALANDLAETIRTTAQGKSVFSVEAIEQLLSPSGSSEKNNFNLTDRELEVLKWMADGLTMPEVAGKLSISQSTVKFHLGNICNKMGVRTKSEALIVAAKNRLV